MGATCDPDTFTVSYDGANHYQVKSKKCGNKGNKTIFEGTTYNLPKMVLLLVMSSL